MKDEIKTGLLAHAGAHVLLHLALMTPPSILPHKQLALVFLPAVLACDAYSWITGLGFLGAVHGLWATELLLFRNPREDFKLLHFDRPKGKKTAKSEAKTEAEKNVPVKDGNENKARDAVAKDSESLPWKEPFPASLYQRFWWVWKLNQSFRYISWETFPPPSSPTITKPPTPPAKTTSLTTTRLTWLLHQLLFIAGCLLIQDITNLYVHYDPYFQIEGSIDEQLPRRLVTFLTRYHLHLLPPRALRIAVLGSQQYAIFSLLGALPSVPMVLLGWAGFVSEFYGRMENYPPWMGNPLVVFGSGLRGFWGKFWHQLFRQMFLGPGKAISNLLSLSPKSISASLLRVFVAFIISGFVHAATLPHDIPGVTGWKYAMFFWVHVDFVLFEMTVEYMLHDRVHEVEKAVLGRMAMRVLRGFWVGGVLWFTAPMVVDQLVRVTRVVGLPPLMFFRAKV